MSLRSPVGNEAAKALGSVRPDLLEAVSRKMTPRQRQALEAWKRLGDDATPEAVADELDINESGARQLLAAAGAIRTRPGHSRRHALLLLKGGMSAAAVKKQLKLHHLILEFAIHDFAYELLVERGGELPTSQRIDYASPRRRSQ